MNTIRAESPTVATVESAAEQRGWRIHRLEPPHLSIPLPRTWEELRSRLSKKMQEAVPAQRRMLEKGYRAQVKRCASAEELPRFLAELFRLHALRWKSLNQPGAFTPARQDFYKRMADRLLANGWLGFRSLELDGVPAAAQFGFCYGGVYSYLQSGFDPAYARYSPGWVLGEMILRDIIGRRRAEIRLPGRRGSLQAAWGRSAAQLCVPDVSAFRQPGGGTVPDAHRGATCGDRRPSHHPAAEQCDHKEERGEVAYRKAIGMQQAPVGTPIAAVPGLAEISTAGRHLAVNPHSRFESDELKV